jgi:hypothetical protein
MAKTSVKAGRALGFDLPMAVEAANNFSLDDLPDRTNTLTQRFDFYWTKARIESEIKEASN